MGKNVAMVVFLLAVVAGLGALVALGPDALKVHKAKSAVAERLMDPDSAKFRNVRVVGSYVCGEVNGKNGFGAYPGFQRFAFGSGIVFLEDAGRYTSGIAEACE